MSTKILKIFYFTNHRGQLYLTHQKINHNIDKKCLNIMHAKNLKTLANKIKM